jgi:hypothetical protein
LGTLNLGGYLSVGVPGSIGCSMCWGASRMTSRGAGPGRLEIKAVVGAWTILGSESAFIGCCSIVICEIYLKE